MIMSEDSNVIILRVSYEILHGYHANIYAGYYLKDRVNDRWYRILVSNAVFNKLYKGQEKILEDLYRKAI